MEWSGTGLEDPLLLPCWALALCFLSEQDAVPPAVGDAECASLCWAISWFFEPHPLTPLKRHTQHVMLCWQTVLLFTVMVWYFLRSPAMVAVDQVPCKPPYVSVSQCNFQGTSLDVVSWGLLVISILIYWNLWYWMLHNKTQSQLDVCMRKSWNLFHRIELFSALPKPAYCVS